MSHGNEAVRIQVPLSPRVDLMEWPYSRARLMYAILNFGKSKQPPHEELLSGLVKAFEQLTYHTETRNTLLGFMSGNGSMFVPFSFVRECPALTKRILEAAADETRPASEAWFAGAQIARTIAHLFEETGVQTTARALLISDRHDCGDATRASLDELVQQGVTTMGLAVGQTVGDVRNAEKAIRACGVTDEVREGLLTAPIEHVIMDALRKLHYGNRVAFL